jgi:penicillin-binding protein 2
MGFGQIFDIGIPGQKKGVVGSTEWKRTAVKREPKWQPGDSVSYGIGQGYVAVNALQLAVMTARLANSTKALNPRLIKSVGGVERPPGDLGVDLPFAPEHLAYVRGGMVAVANDTSGTAYRQSQLGLGDIQMAGKTGTAQVRSYAGLANRSGVGVPWRLKDHNLFVAFAPVDDPRYAVAVIVEHGGLGGATAGAPRAREVMRVALLKDPELRARIETPLPLPVVPEAVDAEGAAPDAPTFAPAPAPPAPAPGAPAPPPSQALPG